MIIFLEQFSSSRHSAESHNSNVDTSTKKNSLEKNSTDDDNNDNDDYDLNSMIVISSTFEDRKYPTTKLGRKTILIFKISLFQNFFFINFFDTQQW